MLTGSTVFGLATRPVKMNNPITDKQISNAAYRLYAYLQERQMEKEDVYKITTELGISSRSYYRFKACLIKAQLQLFVAADIHILAEVEELLPLPEVSIDIPEVRPDWFENAQLIAVPKNSTAGSTEGFKRFYTAYPRKVGRRSAEMAFKRAIERGGDIETIISRTEAYAEMALDIDMKFIPHPSTWLNQDRFEDEEITKKSEAPTGDLVAVSL